MNDVAADNVLRVFADLCVFARNVSSEVSSDEGLRPVSRKAAKIRKERRPCPISPMEDFWPPTRLK